MPRSIRTGSLRYWPTALRRKPLSPGARRTLSATLLLPAAPPARMKIPLLAAPLAGVAAAEAVATCEAGADAADGTLAAAARDVALPSLSAKRASMPAGSTSST